MTFAPNFKFAFIACCLAVAVISFFRCTSKKEWAWLVGGLSFTVLADYFLVLRNEHLLGIAAFCFAHICYIARAIEFKKRQIAYALVFLSAWLCGIFFDIVVVAGLYALLFGINIYVNFKAKHRPKFNYYAVLAGLILFALCDINVMLFNLPVYLGVTNIFPWAFTLIWVFYLPSQLLLAVSAFRLKKA
jgi:hypothetical protein